MLVAERGGTQLTDEEIAADTLEYRKDFNFRALPALPISFQPAS